MKFKPPASETQFIKTAKKFQFEIFPHKKIKGYEWGQGPVIVCIHGWAGRGSQFRKFVNPLIESGFQVVAFDGPAHGRSDGRSTDPLEFELALQEIEKIFTPIAGYITHSFGGTALLFSFFRGMHPKPTVFIGVPAIGEDVVSTYVARIHASRKFISYFEKYVEKKYGNSFYEISAFHTASSMKTTPALVIQDADDKDVPRIHGEKLMEALPNANLLMTRGLGHSRVLRDNHVVEKTVEFFKKNVKKEAK